jgi:hypothetical protein
MSLRWTEPAPAGAALLASVLLGAAGCGGAGARATEPEAGGIPEVIFSVANADRFATAADIEITVNGHALIYGPFSPSPRGRYLYFSTRIPGKKMAIRAVSRSGAGVLAAERTVIVEDRAWVVITRLERDGVAEIEIAISYEKPLRTEPGF